MMTVQQQIRKRIPEPHRRRWCSQLKLHPEKVQVPQFVHLLNQQVRMLQ